MEKFLSLLGMARRANRLSLGHDAVIESIVHSRAKLCLAAADASARLKNELAHACSYGGKNIRFIELPCNMKELSSAIGSKAAAVSVNDEGFSSSILKHITKG